MINPLLTPELLELIEAGDAATLREFCDDTHPRNVADFIAALPDADVWRLLQMLPPALRAEIFSHFDLDRQVQLATGQTRSEMARLVEELPPDDRADLVARLHPQVREEILAFVARAEREDIRRLIAQQPGTSGAAMSTDYATLRPELTVAEALDQIRHQAPHKETIYYLYVVDKAHRLIGFVSLRKLILSKPSQRVGDIMQEEVVSVRVDQDQEDVARIIEKYDLLAVPVIDEQGMLVGIVTHDDAMDIIRQEQTEDMERFMAIAGSHQGEYLKSSPWVHFTNRGGWVVGLAAVGLISGIIIHGFEDALVQLHILALYMPMLADTGGNTGSQSATVVVRALALGEITPGDAMFVLWKEFQISCMLALVLGVLSYAKVLFLSQGAHIPEGFTLLGIGAVITLALVMQVISATLIGATLPMLAARFRLDPAVVASPALTTVVDITGLLIYFSLARWLLGV